MSTTPRKFFTGPQTSKKLKFSRFSFYLGGRIALLKMKNLDVVTLGDDSDSLIPRITPKLFFSFTPMARGLEGSKIIL